MTLCLCSNPDIRLETVPSIQIAVVTEPISQSWCKTEQTDVCNVVSRFVSGCQIWCGSLGFRYGLGKHLGPDIAEGTVGSHLAKRSVPLTCFPLEPHVHDQGEFWAVIEDGLALLRIEPDLGGQEVAAGSDMESHRFLKVYVLDSKGMQHIWWDFGAGQKLDTGAEPFVFGIRVVVACLEFQDLSDDGDTAEGEAAGAEEAIVP